jgi:hypothetical protein
MIGRWNLRSLHPYLGMSNVLLCKKVGRSLIGTNWLQLTLLPNSGDSINQGDLTVEIVH